MTLREKVRKVLAEMDRGEISEPCPCGCGEPLPSIAEAVASRR